MVLASDYPLLDVFLTMLWFVGFFIWIWLLIAVFADIFRSHDMGGGMKALWIVGVLVLPILGVLIYLLARGGKMQQHAVEEAQAREAATQQYIKSVATDSAAGSADELAKLAQLRDSGVLSQEEFESEKSRVLARAS